ncbi:type IV toxin-antitoxin system AbiEi family antitoxin domain-containing protein [Engelhardtia mirabilis]|uniref:AbiEi antitoxin N-terminal domain-containing protein n=1 Tax=Engelhardtia mirabilis TaxID=2528011 RepID=A0A518BIY5_9BACT|nr:hypothetical protein Pla133_20000 [Planctomycetes bacterium Pla133]QDV01251.1 hypothetical protein Pla86_20000 [Planctomycetes bacterium Pla86]
MNYRDTQQARRALASTAADQGGYFTAKQATAAGYSRQHVSYHVAAGNFERVGRGLFRLPTIPLDSHDDLIQLSLWSRGRDDLPQAVVSHESALSLHELSQILPGKVHLTVPTSFRKQPPSNCVLHRGVVGSDDRSQWTGFAVTTPLRTLVDIARTREISSAQLGLAVEDALDRGLVRRRAIRAVVAGSADLERLEEALIAID